MVQLENVHKSYRQGAETVEALRGVSLSIPDAGFFALMGPSGSGKTTLLHLIAGLDRPDQGKIIVDGQDITRQSERALTMFRRRRIGVVFQKFNLIPTLTAAQNVGLPGLIDGRPTKWIKGRVDEMLAALGMSARANHRPDALSGGEQQRIAIARALLFAPPLLLADEPTGNLDSASSQRLWTLLGQLAKDHQMTVLMVTHEPAAAAHCQRAFVIGDGQLKGEFEVDEPNASVVASRYQLLGR